MGGGELGDAGGGVKGRRAARVSSFSSSFDASAVASSLLFSSLPSLCLHLPLSHPLHRVTFLYLLHAITLLLMCTLVERTTSFPPFLPTSSYPPTYLLTSPYPPLCSLSIMPSTLNPRSIILILIESPQTERVEREQTNASLHRPLCLM